MVVGVAPVPVARVEPPVPDAVGGPLGLVPVLGEQAASPDVQISGCLAPELVPVVVQDPVWERSFPDVGGVTVPYADSTDGRVVPVYLTRAEADRLRSEHEARLENLTRIFRSLGTEPVTVASHEPGELIGAFLRWADLRVLVRGAVA